jgi:transcriptional regulator with XRE-family HTH domain
MKDRIKELLIKENISSSQLADKIGVQRSSISHVLSGRNKPGFDFIQKILITFPGISGDWLITGSGEMYRQKSPSQRLTEPPVADKTFDFSAQNDREKTTAAEELKNDKATNDVQEKRSIEKVIIFYTDKTFREYYAEA